MSILYTVVVGISTSNSSALEPGPTPDNPRYYADRWSFEGGSLSVLGLLLVVLRLYTLPKR